MRRRVAEITQADTTATPLHKAACAHNPFGHMRQSEPKLLEDMQALLKSGASVNERDGAGVTPTHTAAAYGTPALLGALLEAGADLAAVDIVGQVRWFLCHGVRLLSESEWGGGQTPLHYAAALGRIELVTMLMAAGSPVNVIDASGRTPLDLIILMVPLFSACGCLCVLTRVVSARDQGTQCRLWHI
jgi:ankyrin repeat protein